MSVPSEPTSSMVDASPGTALVTRIANYFPRSRQLLLLVIALIVNDVVMAALAFGAAFWARFQLDIPIFETEFSGAISFYRLMAGIFTPLWLAIYAVLGLYNHRNLLGGTEEYARVFRATTYGVLAVITIGFLSPDLILARGWLLASGALCVVLVSSGRFLLRRTVYGLRRYGYFVANTIIVGANPEGFSLAQQLLGWQRSGMNLVGFVDDNARVGNKVFRRLSNLGTTDQLESIINRFSVEEVIFVTSALPRETLIQLYRKYSLNRDLNLSLSSGLYEIMTTGVELAQLVNVPLVRVNMLRQTGTDRFLKFVLDYGVTIPLLLFIGPLMLLVALAIKLESPGPVIHRRRVMGKNLKEFEAYKFRTMYTNGDEILQAFPELREELARNHKLRDDPRVTRVGRFLRQYSIDELPQLVNVLKRQMSVVGPRMITLAEMRMYAQWDRNLLTVNPGITGLWQVSGRSDTTYEERVQMDMHYIRTWTIWSDIYIIWLTIPAVFGRRGAY